MPHDTKPTIAVVIPTYNRANTIVASIESVLSQSYPINEILIVDDHSTDDTIKQLDKFKDDIIILHTKNRLGAQAARNIGIKAAKSEWIAFLDSDDEWLPNKIIKQVSSLNKYDFKIL
jgi:glycosyltransferase involved in cell wall biosynthesis